MNTPIVDFLRHYAESDTLRLHMPGHKGSPLLGMESWDITEVVGADDLYHADGIIRESEENAARLFGCRTLYSTEGASLAIRAMLYLAVQYARYQGKSPRILAGRNAHRSFLSAAVLLDLDVIWLQPAKKESYLSCAPTAEEIENILSQPDAPTAVYLTSPDYLGGCADISAIADVCHRHGVLLLVDNAHGAYLKFLPQSCHPMDLGADLCCDSAHKTLPVLTGGAYLHIAKAGFLADHAETAMSMFASTSPSYLILQSLDACNRYLSEEYPRKLKDLVPQICALKDRLEAAGYTMAGCESLKITIAPKSRGYTGTELGQLLEEQNIVCEFCDPDYLVMMVTPENSLSDLQRMEEVLCSVPQKTPILKTMPTMQRPVQAMSMHDAILQPGQKLPISQCAGRILASPTVSCPPAIPVLVCGETVTADAIAVMEYYGIQELSVI